MVAIEEAMHYAERTGFQVIGVIRLLTSFRFHDHQGRNDHARPGQVTAVTGATDCRISCTQEILELRSTPSRKTPAASSGTGTGTGIQCSRTGEKLWRFVTCQHPGTWDSRHFRSGESLTLIHIGFIIESFNRKIFLFFS